MTFSQKIHSHYFRNNVYAKYFILGSKDDDEREKELQLKKYLKQKGLSPALKWFIKYQHTSEKYKDAFKKSYIEELKKYRLKKSTKLYRILSWDDEFAGDEIQDFLQNYKIKGKVGEVFNYIDTPFSSWTKDKEYVLDQPQATYKIILEAMVSPDATFLDFDNLPSSIDTPFINEREILVYKPIKAKIIHVFIEDEEEEDLDFDEND